MRSIVQVEYRPSLLTIREEILATFGHPVAQAPIGTSARAERCEESASRHYGRILLVSTWYSMPVGESSGC